MLHTQDIIYVYCDTMANLGVAMGPPLKNVCSEILYYYHGSKFPSEAYAILSENIVHDITYKMFAVSLYWYHWNDRYTIFSGGSWTKYSR